jgi:biotin transport system substrate-specific component
MAYGARYGAYVVAAYLLAGIIGMPVFADYSDGIAKLYGPTAGYLIGFIPAVLLSGYLAQKGWAKTIAGSFVAASLGVSMIFICGVTVLSQFIGFHNAITVGVMPFVIAEPLKLIAASCIIPRFWK